MTRRMTALAAAAVLFCAVGALPVGAQTPSLDEIVAKNVAARTGQGKLGSVNTMKIGGTIDSQGMAMPLTVMMKRPNKVRQEMTVQGQQIVQAYDGQQAWAINPMLGPGPQVIEGVQANALKSVSLIDGLLVGYKERGDTLELVGPSEVDGAKTWKLKLTRGDGYVVHVDIDAETGLERQWSSRMEQEGMAMDVNTVMSDYQPADGVPVARTMRTMMNGQPVATLKIDSVEFNVPVEDSAFAMPAK